jgi:hypothetical protein
MKGRVGSAVDISSISYARIKGPRICTYWIFWVYRYHTLVSRAQGYAHIAYFGHTDIIYSIQGS